MLKTKISLKQSRIAQSFEIFLRIIFRILEKNIHFLERAMQPVRKIRVYLSARFCIVYQKNIINTVVKDFSHLIKIFSNNSGVKRPIRFQNHTRLQADRACTKIHTESWSCHSISDYQHLLA